MENLSDLVVSSGSFVCTRLLVFLDLSDEACCSDDELVSAV